MGDGARALRERCVECYQYREDCGQGQACRACRLQDQLEDARELAQHYHLWIGKLLLQLNEQSYGKVLLKNEERFPWLKKGK